MRGERRGEEGKRAASSKGVASVEARCRGGAGCLGAKGPPDLRWRFPFFFCLLQFPAVLSSRVVHICSLCFLLFRFFFSCFAPLHVDVSFCFRFLLRVLVRVSADAQNRHIHVSKKNQRKKPLQHTQTRKQEHTHTHTHKPTYHHEQIANVGLRRQKQEAERHKHTGTGCALAKKGEEKRGTGSAEASQRRCNEEAPRGANLQLERRQRAHERGGRWIGAGNGSCPCARLKHHRPPHARTRKHRYVCVHERVCGRVKTGLCVWVNVCACVSLTKGLTTPRELHRERETRSRCQNNNRKKNS